MKKREIKFRAWDKGIMKVTLIDWTPTDEIELIFTEDEKGSYEYKGFDLSKVKLMQFTGLKDKNGKEIYEGDLLKPESKGEKPYLIKYQRARFKPYFWDFANNRWAEDEWKVEMEVIGNIYEDSHLLK